VIETTDSPKWQNWRPKCRYCRFWWSVVVAIAWG